MQANDFILDSKQAGKPELVAALAMQKGPEP